VLTLTAPLDLGRPRAGEKVVELNRIVTRAAAETGGLLLDLSSFGARNLVMADHVHPTAFGQIAIAERALDVLAADGLQPVVRPSTLIHYETTRWKRLRGDATYAYRHAKVSARAAWLKALAK
jgi:phospholipase/lecithinase/hemolysin